MSQRPAPADRAAPRLDVWLDIACLFKTRSAAQKACRLGQVSLNGTPARPHREVRIGDRLTITRAAGHQQVIVVQGVTSGHVAKSDARRLYDDRTPPPTPEQVAMRQLERLTRATAAEGRPARNDRRARRRLSGKD